MSFDGPLSLESQIAASGSAIHVHVIKRLRQAQPQREDQGKALLDVARTLSDEASTVVGKPNAVRLNKP
jgi:hypothetical protein